LLAKEEHIPLVTSLRTISRLRFERSVVYSRAVRRIPVKLPVLDDVEESKHLEASYYDGLKLFYPVDLYRDNIVATDGLLKNFQRVQNFSGFGLKDHPRAGSYSFLLVDVAVFWQLLRPLYSYTGMARIRHDLFLIFGLWHAYNYSHVALWTEFRATFLAPAFFAIFPHQNRLAYFRDDLSSEILRMKEQMLRVDVQIVQTLETKGGKKMKTHIGIDIFIFLWSFAYRLSKIMG